MPTVLILSSTQAAQVKGPSVEQPAFAALSPIALTDGRYVLGVGVLADPLHAEKWPLLSTLPQADSATIQTLLPARA